jgi:putative endopeptidase
VFKGPLTSSACLIGALLLVGCSAFHDTAPKISRQESKPREIIDTAERLPVAGFNIDDLDTTVRPQDDFYQFVNGGWLDRTEIPPDRPRWGTFDELIEHSEYRVRAIIEDFVAARDNPPHPDSAKIADLYLSFMDEDAVEAAGLQPLASWLERIHAVADHDALATEFGALRAQGAITSLPLSFWVDLDFADTQRYTTYFGQSGLGMPDRDYYLVDDDRLAETRQAYVRYIARLFELAGSEPGAAAQSAERVFALETSLAKLHWTRAARRDRQRTYNPVPLDSLGDAAPDFNWPAYLAAAGLDDVDEIVLREYSYFPAVTALIAATPIPTWREYLRFKLLDEAAPLLSRPFVDAHFDLHHRAISGIPEQQLREDRVVRVIEQAFGEAIGREYVARHFPPEHRARMETMVANLKAAFRESIDALEWMSEATKAEARSKLASFGVKIGYPDTWRDYGALEIHASDLVGNIHRTKRFDYERMVGRLGATVDPDEWLMTPQTVNAYYSATRNEIVFPAAILRPPFFNPTADDAINYGAIGAVIGHEISHGFDDQGRRTDGAGLLRDWWTELDDARYRSLADRLVALYGAFEPLEGVHIDGEVSLGENIADNAGLTVALRAYRRSLGEGEAPVIDGFTGEQRFFMGWAQVWRIQFRDDALRRQLMSGHHSPGRYRVIGVVRNIDAFHVAFEVREGDGMWLAPEERVAIW